MTVFLIGAIVCIILDLLLLYRVFRGPTAADRICAMDALDLVTALALVLYSVDPEVTYWPETVTNFTVDCTGTYVTIPVVE